MEGSKNLSDCLEPCRETEAWPEWGSEVMRAVAATCEARLDEVRAKFMRLLEMERSSPDFLRLYEEVDAALAELLRAEEARDEAV